MNYYDVKYISPAGNEGLHTAFLAKSEVEAKQQSPIWLSYGTPWKPEEWTVISVVATPKENLPLTPDEFAQFQKKQKFEKSISYKVLKFLRILK
jgi:hypothetical protein